MDDFQEAIENRVRHLLEDVPYRRRQLRQACSRGSWSRATFVAHMLEGRGRTAVPPLFLVDSHST
ncbi:MAG: hypothetical protein HKN71_12120 [Gemmatimonadetes bacterium]|nr:hypothetical protein [Gemmatimonadota bacterium]